MSADSDARHISKIKEILGKMSPLTFVIFVFAASFVNSVETCIIYGSTIYCSELCEYPPKHFYREMKFVHIGEAYDETVEIDLRCLQYFPNATVSTLFFFNTISFLNHFIIV